MKKIISVVVAVSFFMAGCASMFNGSKDMLYIRSEEPDTHFFVNQRDLGTGKSTVTAVSKKDLSTSVLRVEKAGCNAKEMPIETQFDATTLLGILLDWGIFSILIVDWAVTGAVVKAAQTEYVLTPDCPKQAQQQQVQPTAQPVAQPGSQL